VPQRPRMTSFDAVGIGLVAAVTASVLPWTRFGISSGLFGAWGVVQLRWSTLAAAASALGLVLWLGVRLRGRIEGLSLVGLFVLSLASIAGTILHCYNPPPFTHAWLGPWVAIPSAAFAACATTWTFLTFNRSRRTARGVP
jgi:hypothetical protein